MAAGIVADCTVYRLNGKIYFENVEIMHKIKRLVIIKTFMMASSLSSFSSYMLNSMVF